MKLKRFSTGLTSMVRMSAPYHKDTGQAQTILVSLGIMLAVIVATSIFCYGLEAGDIEMLVDGDYYGRVMGEFKEAKESIYAEMYMVKLEGESKGIVQALAGRLIEAQKKGVEVNVLLEGAPWHEMNKRFYDLLSKEGIKVRYDSPDRVLHAKTIVIDGYKVILGSHNWSYYSLRQNHEAGILIKSREIASLLSVARNDNYRTEDEPDAVILDEDTYFKELINAIQESKESISIVMFEYELNPNRKFDTTSRLTDELISAIKRGVTVHIILDQNFKRMEDRFGKAQSVIEKKNLMALRRLQEEGANAQFDKADKVTHCKLVIIDGKIVLLGSQNWTERSIENDEISILIKSKTIAEAFLAYMARIETEPDRSGHEDYDDGYAIKAGWNFFSGVGSRMYTNGAFKAIDLYLVLLWEWDGNPEGRVALDYEKLTTLSGGRDFKYFRMVKRVLRDLDRKYRLIRFDEEKDSAYLLDYDNSNLAYKEPKREFVELPFIFWKYGWAKKLSMKARYVYFINLIERNKSTIKPWWFDSQERLSERYNISVKTIVGGLQELERYNLIEIYRFSPEPGEPYWHRWSNQYYINEMESPALVQKRWVDLEVKYGRKDIDRAIKLAGQLNDPLDPGLAERFIQLIEQYGYSKVKKANNITARLSVENPKRHIGYTISILMGESI